MFIGPMRMESKIEKAYRFFYPAIRPFFILITHGSHIVSDKIFGTVIIVYCALIFLTRRREKVNKKKILVNKNPARSMRRSGAEFLNYVWLSGCWFDFELEYIRPIYLLTTWWDGNHHSAVILSEEDERASNWDPFTVRFLLSRQAKIELKLCFLTMSGKTKKLINSMWGLLHLLFPVIFHLNRPEFLLIKRG